MPRRVQTSPTTPRRAPNASGLLCLCLACAALGAFAPVVPRASEQPADPPEGPTAEPPPVEPQAAEPVDPEDLPEAVVVLASGQKITGKLLEQDDSHVVLLVGNIRLDLSMSQVDRVDVQPSVSQHYEALKKSISPRDLPSRVMLAQWLFDKERYEWSLLEIEAVLDEDPAYPEAQRLHRLVVSQLDLKARSGQPRLTPQTPADRPAKFQFPLLSPEQINLIKVFEVNLADPPRMTIDRATIDRLIAENPGNEHLPPTPEGRDAIYHRPAAEILDLMFKMQARNLYGQVQVRDQPRSMERFRNDVQQTWLVNSCATNRCHGGAEAGRLRLYNRKPNSDPSVYTNFLILDRFRMADGRPLIDYGEPAKSPLVQLALPRASSEVPHPPVPASNGRGDVWQPALDAPSDKRFAQAIAWIKSMYQPRPEYPVEYDPPGQSTVPSNAAAPAPPR